MTCQNMQKFIYNNLSTLFATVFTKIHLFVSNYTGALITALRTNHKTKVLIYYSKMLHKVHLEA